MRVTSTAIADLKIIDPDYYSDNRGSLFESFSANRYADEAGIKIDFVQDNHSRSTRNVLRGLHYQITHPQGKLVRSVVGIIFDVGVDIRTDSPSFGHWAGVILSADNRRQLWLPPGFAHGFFVLSDVAEVLYKTTAYYDPADEHCLAWNDPAIGIEWPLDGVTPIVSDRDNDGLSFKEIQALQ
ncbi:MAG TPA: dTDP-4-dehydrorhamnose 3,5-epimerase [Gammaproteobacteria bacterium]|nr:dTDP-4-dehydrorhamnose 3,5-epimerase [Gammaproteobacteria bacterium]|tara:strand:- start:4009 stop:4557 length:549 start_codon:yes stop_codon:yes gene_type:complete